MAFDASIRERLPSGTFSALGKDTQLTQELSMSTTSRVLKPQTDDLPADVIELGNVLASFPVEYQRLVEPIFSRVVESTKRRRRILNLVQDALGQLRLDMKYLMFDLEATRRERDDYRRKFEET
jgi:hypothetical protein